MEQHSQTLLLIIMAISLLCALPFLYQVCRTVCIAIYYYWWRPKRYLKLTFTEGDKTATIIVDPELDYVLQVEEALIRKGFTNPLTQTQTKPD